MTEEAIDRELRDATTPYEITTVLEAHAPRLRVDPTFAHRVRCEQRDAAVAQAVAATSTATARGVHMSRRLIAKTNLKGGGTTVAKGEEFDPRALGLSAEAIEKHIAMGTMARVPSPTEVRAREARMAAGIRPMAGTYNADGTPAQRTVHEVAGLERDAGQGGNAGADDSDTAA